MIIDLLKTRCSIRKFKLKPIPEEVVDCIVEEQQTKVPGTHMVLAALESG